MIVIVAAKELDQAATTVKDTNKGASSSGSSGRNTNEGRPALTCYNY